MSYSMVPLVDIAVCQFTDVKSLPVTSMSQIPGSLAENDGPSSPLKLENGESVPLVMIKLLTWPRASSNTTLGSSSHRLKLINLKSCGEPYNCQLLDDRGSGRQACSLF